MLDFNDSDTGSEADFDQEDDDLHSEDENEDSDEEHKDERSKKKVEMFFWKNNTILCLKGAK